MKIRAGFMMRKIADVQVIVPVGESDIDFNGIIMLNDTAAFLFGQLQSDTSRETLLERLLNEYDVDEQTARADIDAFCCQLEGANLIA